MPLDAAVQASVRRGDRKDHKKVADHTVQEDGSVFEFRDRTYSDQELPDLDFPDIE